MKIKVLSRNPSDYIRETKLDVHKMPRNFDPSLHPFEEAREYTRAMNAAKLDRVFAKPFLTSLDGHRDGVQALCNYPKALSIIASGSYDGELRIWDLSSKSCNFSVQAHDGSVKAICFKSDGSKCFTIGDDKAIKLWSVNRKFHGDVTLSLSQSILCRNLINSIDHHPTKDLYVTSGESVHLYDESRLEPFKSFNWGMDNVNSIRFNRSENSVLAACGSDRSILLYDIRGTVPLKKIVMNMRCNAVCWNPLEPMRFTVASEDYNAYSFDMRYLEKPQVMHKGHIMAVMDIDYSPTGREFVTAGYDKTIRVFDSYAAFSRDVYHTRRMQRVVTAKFSNDAKYILSGSDEMNLRLWKARASEKLGHLRPREVASMDYSNKLKEKYQHHPKIRSILKHRHVPKRIYKGVQELNEIKTAKQRKEANRRKFNKKIDVGQSEVSTKVIEHLD